MDPSNLVQMVNRIGEFFAAMPDEHQACEGVALHLCLYWEPRMRLSLLRHIDQAPSVDLLPIVSKAIEIHRHLLA